MPHPARAASPAARCACYRRLNAAAERSGVLNVDLQLSCCPVRFRRGFARVRSQFAANPAGKHRPQGQRRGCLGQRGRSRGNLGHWRRVPAAGLSLWLLLQPRLRLLPGAQVLRRLPGRDGVQRRTRPLPSCGAGSGAERFSADRQQDRDSAHSALVRVRARSALAVSTAMTRMMTEPPRARRRSVLGLAKR